jgi:hypothetical protein
LALRDDHQTVQRMNARERDPLRRRTAACKSRKRDRQLHKDRAAHSSQDRPRFRQPACSRGDPPRAGTRRSRLNGRESVAHEAIQHRVREAVSEHVRHSAAVWGASKQAERPALVSACRHRLSTPRGAIGMTDGWDRLPVRQRTTLHDVVARFNSETSLVD